LVGDWVAETDSKSDVSTSDLSDRVAEMMDADRLTGLEAGAVGEDWVMESSGFSGLGAERFCEAVSTLC
jgi:hypothetical protein